MTNALVNTAIEVKANNANKDFNFYTWLIAARNQFHPTTPLVEFYTRITFAMCTQKSSWSKIPV